MSKRIFKDVQAFIAGNEVSGISNQAALNYGVVVKDGTTFDDSTTINEPGLYEVAFDLSGFWDSTTDSDFFSQLGGTQEVVTVVPTGATEGNPSFFFQAPELAYNFGDQVGEIFPFSLNMQGSDELIGGKSGHDATATAETSSGTSTGFQLASVGSGERLYAALHVISASGTSPTLDVEIESDDNPGFTSAVSRISFTQVTSSVAAEYTSTAGAISDDYFRVKWTIGGSSPSYKFICSIGIK